MVAATPWLDRVVRINFLHFAILIFIISAVVLVVVSWITPRESESKLRGLTFATLEGEYEPRHTGGGRRTLGVQILASVALSLLVIGLWVRFA